jgi:2-polyprenyl-3-methyl-5-hydroxy-6-metoxy-1,4-benzoquinol methylase
VDKFRQYAENQRSQYDSTSQTYEHAKAQVAPNYDHQREIAPSYAKLMLSHYFLRHGQFYRPGQTDLSAVKLLDFGCGVGRVMEAFTEFGVGAVDGCDISSAMLSHAREKAELAKSNFFLTRGFDTGNSPADHYDIAYSFLCLHHIPMRQTRIRILEALARNLKSGGMVFAEFKVFPGATAAKIPPNHAHWTENMVAKHTNSRADVWITPDALGMVYEDFRLFFADIALVEIDFAPEHYEHKPDEIYPFGFNHLFVVGSKEPSLNSNLTKGI